MNRRPRWFLGVASPVVALAAVALAAVSWKDRADDICRTEAAEKNGLSGRTRCQIDTEKPQSKCVLQ
jgi:hypothetical protein